jgi:hypothetical protein
MEELVIQYLDVAPLIVALRNRPAEFEFRGPWLFHLPSRHRFKFDSSGHVSIDAACDCSALSAQHAQGIELWGAYQHWYYGYWRPLLINREFASHFKGANLWQRLHRSMKIRTRRIFRDHHGRAPASATAE